MNVKITRRSQVGFGYSSACEQVWNKTMTQSWLQPVKTEAPCITGTVLQVEKEISEDLTFKSFKSDGTSYSCAWFIKVNGSWRKVCDDPENMYNFAQLTDENDSYAGKKYRADYVVVEVE